MRREWCCDHCVSFVFQVHMDELEEHKIATWRGKVDFWCFEISFERWF